MLKTTEATAPQIKAASGADAFVDHDAEMIEDFLKLCRCLAALMRGQLNRSYSRPARFIAETNPERRSRASQRRRR